MRRSTALIAAAACLACAGTRGPAPPANAAFPPPQTDAQLEARLRFLEERLDAGHLHAAAWYCGWLGVESLAALSQVGDAATADHSEDRERDIVNAVKSGVGVADILLRPMPGRRGASPLRAMPDATQADKLARLARGEEILRAAAERADARRSWPVHVGNLAFNLAGSAVLLGLDHAGMAGLMLLNGTVGGELEIWSEPWRAPHDLADYQRLIETGHAAQPPAPSWGLAPARDGVALEMRF